MLSIHELSEKLKQEVDEISLLEVLNISAEDIVERFQDRIEERYGRLVADFSDGEELEND